MKNNFWGYRHFNHMWQPERNFCNFISKGSLKSIISLTDERLKLSLQANNYNDCVIESQPS